MMISNSYQMVDFVILLAVRIKLCIE